jgi:hypothetical protein
MAIYKIFPEKDTTIYSRYPNMNTGLDEILEISNLENITTNPTSGQVSRILIKFPTSEITNTLLNKVGNSSFTSSLKLFLAHADNIPLDFNIECYPIYSSWNMGSGRYLDLPNTTNGTGWEFRLQSGSGEWLTTGFPTYVTASFTSTNGGGNWYTGSNTLNPEAIQSFNYITPKDIEFNITNTIQLFNSGSIVNEGFIIKLEDSLEFTTSHYLSLKYFSMDTHTIYPPYLEIKWDDSIFNTGSSSQTILDTAEATISLRNNKGEFQQDSIQKFRINSRPTYPVRTFTTNSLYTTNYYLPSSSLYQVKDVNTDEIIIDFDQNNTKISADSISNYFDLYMSGLEPERYYKILIKTVLDGSTIVFDNDYIFKVVR